ncbi:hypothetical protein [Priestia koreensis]|nr:hypothetical protein [Priestia koreensis]
MKTTPTVNLLEILEKVRDEGQKNEHIDVKGFIETISADLSKLLK